MVDISSLKTSTTLGRECDCDPDYIGAQRRRPFFKVPILVDISSLKTSATLGREWDCDLDYIRAQAWHPFFKFPLWSISPP